MEADQAGGDRKEALMNIVTALIADPKSALLVQPANGALDDVSHLSKSTAMFRAPFGQEGIDPSQRRMPRAGSES